MQKVIVVNLNGNAYQLEEPAYQALQAYLDTAAERLAANPDKTEILADIEQAIADKCGRHLGPHKNVVSGPEMSQIIEEMGPVDGADASEPGGAAEAPGAQGQANKDPFANAQKRLYQIEDGAIISGVCNGLGAYFDVDPTIVRVIFVVLAFLTGGFWILVYLVLMFVIPTAETPEQHAAAHGLPFNAHQLIRRAKGKYAELTAGTDWRRQWKRQRRAWRAQQRHWKHYWRGEMAGPPPHPDGPAAAYVTHVIAGALAPVFVLLGVALFFLFAVALVSLLMTGTIFDWTPPGDLPLWAAILILFLLYQVFAWPLHAARHAAHYALGYGFRHSGAEGAITLGFGVLCFWLAYHYIPEVHEFARHFTTLWPGIWENIRESWN
jgi:phage shock protein PspC (stress-responsive transcriptional regulator)